MAKVSEPGISAAFDLMMVLLHQLTPVPPSNPRHTLPVITRMTARQSGIKQIGTSAPKPVEKGVILDLSTVEEKLMNLISR